MDVRDQLNVWRSVRSCLGMCSEFLRSDMFYPHIVQVQCNVPRSVVNVRLFEVGVKRKVNRNANRNAKGATMGGGKEVAGISATIFFDTGKVREMIRQLALRHGTSKFELDAGFGDRSCE